MEAALELLKELASKGVKLSLEGDDLTCYAQKGLLTKEIRDCIVQNKPRIVNILTDYKKARSAMALSGARSKTQAIHERIDKRAESKVLLVEPRVVLGAEAVLDPGIQPSSAVDDGVDFSDARVILLTGASGFLGAYLLHDIMMATEACVYCLVRCRSESDGSQRIKSNLLKYGLWSDDFASRIVPVPGDLAQPLLGTGAETFDNLCKVIDAVYHNGALVNFIYPYSNLKDSNVRGTEEVIRLACQVRRKPLHFISTIGVFPSTVNRNTRVLESDPPTNWQELTDGYRQSKWVAEKIVTIAAGRGLPVRIYRPGFVAGDSTTGTWNTDDFVPRIIKGCIQLGCAPDSDAMIEIVPVDYVSKTIVHLSRQRELRSNVFHVVSPHYIPAREIARIVGSLGYKMTMVPYADWRDALFEDAKTSSKNALYPLLTMFTDALPFEQAPTFDCRQTLEGLRGTQIICPEINTDLMATYLTYFKSSGFLAT